MRWRFLILMAKKSRKKQHAQPKKDSAGCISGLISIFDFRQGRSTQKLLSDRRHGSARHGGDSGGGYFRGKLNLLTGSEGEDKRTNVVDTVGEKDNVSTSIKVLMEEEMSRVQLPTETSKTYTQQVIPLELVNEKNQMNTTEPSALSWDLLSDDKSIFLPDNWDNLDKILKRSSDPHLSSLLDHCCDDSHQCKRLLSDMKSILNSSLSHGRADEVLHDFHSQSSNQVVMEHFTFHQLLIETAETLIDQDVKAPCETYHQLGDLVGSTDASNFREVLLKLLQDPRSVFVRRILELNSGQEGKISHLGACSLHQESNVSSRQFEEPTNHKLLSQKAVHMLFRKKDRIPEERVKDGNNNAQPLSNIVVLKPTPPTRSSSIAVNSSTSQSCDALKSDVHKGKIAFQFSLKEIKRRLRHVIGDNGKGKHILSMDGVLHKIPYGPLQSGYSDHKLKDGERGKSSGKTAHQKQHATQLSSISRGNGKSLQLKESHSNKAHEVVQQGKSSSIATSTSRREHNFQQEARKRLVDMFNFVDNEASLPVIKTSKPLGRMLSLTEYDFLSPRIRTEREKKYNLSPRQLRFSPLCQLELQNEKHASSPRESIDDSKFDREGENPTRDMLKEENRSYGDFTDSSHDGGTVAVEFPDAQHAQERYIVDSASESNSGSPTSAIKRSDEEQLPLSPRSTLSGTSHMVDLLVPSTPVSLLVPNVGSPDSICEKPEHPSPVLDPSLTEDSGSPVHRSGRHVDFQGHHPKEHEDSAVVLATSAPDDDHKTCLDEKECRFEYVKAVLEASGLMPGLLSDRWHLYPLLDLSLYDEVEYPSDEFPDDLRQLFDSINEALDLLNQKFFSCCPWLSYTKSGLHLTPSGENLIKEVWKGVDKCLSSQPPRTLDKIMEKDMEVSSWMDLQSSIEHISIDIENMILDNIAEEMLT